MTDKRMIVTGGAQGIGLGITHHMLARGWHVIVFDADKEAIEALDALPESKASMLQAMHVDISDEDQVSEAIAQITTSVPGIDALINNAAISDPYNPPIDKFDLDAWQHKLAVNLTGPFLMCKHSVAALRARQGCIINIASTRALQSEPHHEAYATAKGGLCALTHALAISLGPDIRVNAILPGWIEVSAWKKPSAREEPDLRDIDHAQHPVGRVGRAEDIAHTVDYLCHAGFVTGEQIVVDGGMTKKMIYAE